MRRTRILRMAAAGGLLLLGASRAPAGELGAELEARIAAAAPGEMLDAIVHVRADPELRVRLPRGRAHRGEILRALRAGSAAAQRELLEELAQGRRRGEVLRYRSFWGFDGVALTAGAATLGRIAARPDVERVVYDRVLRRTPSPDPAGEPRSRAAGNAATIAKVPSVWSTYGLSGAGVVVANMDSGVDADHPALAAKWRGGTNSWFDAVHDAPAPEDSGSHGTQTMGLMVAGDGPGEATDDDLGAAHGASWIAARVFDENDEATYSGVHAAFEWFMDPDGDPDTDDQPDVINHSWSVTPEIGACEPEYAADVAALDALGVVQVFSAGNVNPAVDGTLRSPASYADGISVGATNGGKALSSFSARGPSACTGALGPDLVALGEGVRSTTDGGGYLLDLDGTSFSAPMVAGIVALMLETNPGLSPAAVRTLLRGTAEDLGAVGADNGFGWGFVDAAAAVDAAYVPAPWLRPVATSFFDPGQRCAGNGSIDPGERVALDLELENAGFRGATGVHVLLSSTEPGVTVHDGGAVYPDLAAGASSGSIDGFRIEVSPDQPPRSSITLLADIRSNEKRFAAELELEVVGGTYVADDTVPFRWFDATGGTRLELGDDDARVWDLSFAFPYLGEHVERLWVHSNGFVAVVPPTGDVNNSWFVPSTYEPDGLIAPYWDNMTPNLGGDVYVMESGAAPERLFVASWNDVPRNGVSDGASFQVAIEEGGDIHFHYLDTVFADGSGFSNGRYAAAGIESRDGTEGVGYSHDQPVLTSGKAVAIRFEDCAPDPVCTDVDGDGYALEGGACGPVDCDDGAPAVNPGAVEIPANGVDDDCDPSTPTGCESGPR